MAELYVARCAIHGLHGERTECYVCGGPVEQVPMVELEGPAARSGRHSAVEASLHLYNARIAAEALSRRPQTPDQAAAVAYLLGALDAALVHAEALRQAYGEAVR